MIRAFVLDAQAPYGADVSRASPSPRHVCRLLVKSKSPRRSRLVAQPLNASFMSLEVLDFVV
jgi:hypothetical protein